MSSRPCPSCGHPIEWGDDPAVTVRCSRCGTVEEPPDGTDMGPLPPARRGQGTPWPPRAPKPSVAPTTDGPPLPRLQGYEGFEFLARGKRGPVFKARQTGLKRLVAIQVLEDLPAGSDEKARFRLEVETLLRLDHENIAPVLDIRDSDGRLHLAMEFCAGGSLEARLEKGPLPQQEAVALVYSLARAVEAAHDKGVVHGELNAADVLVSDAGPPKLIGFGLGRLTTGCESEPQDDIEALGELLRQCLKEVPVPLEAVCRRCALRDEETSYDGAGELADDLARILAAARATSGRNRRSRLWRPLRRRWFVLPLLAAVFLSLEGALAVLALESGRASLPVDRSRADVWVGSVSSFFENDAPVSLSLLNDVKRQPGVAAVEACLVGEAGWRKPGGGRVHVLVVGGELGPDGLGPLAALPNRLREKLRTEGTVVVCMDDLEALGLPGTLDQSGLVGEESVRVVGHVAPPASSLGPVLYCSPATARKLLRLGPDEATFLLARCDEACSGSEVADGLRKQRNPLRARDRAALSLALRLDWLASAPWMHVWVGAAFATTLAAALVLARLLPREPGDSRRLAWLRATLAIAAAALLADAVVRAALAWGWPEEAFLFPAFLLEGATAHLAMLLSLLVAACLRRPRAAAPAPFRGRPASRAR